MTNQPTQEEINTWHKYFAVECNNRAWELIEKPERTAYEGREMVFSAYSAAFHWSKVGTPINHARAEIVIAHVYSLLDDGARAMYYAQSALAFFQSGQGADWDLAFAHLEVALAGYTQGNNEQHRLYFAQAHDLGEAIQDPEDREIFMQMLSRIPLP